MRRLKKRGKHENLGKKQERKFLWKFLCEYYLPILAKLQTGWMSIYNLSIDENCSPHEIPSLPTNVFAENFLHMFLDILKLNVHSWMQVSVSSIVLQTVCLFFSAHWCRACRNFTPQLIQAYEEMKQRGDNLEVVFHFFRQRFPATLQDHAMVGSSIWWGPLQADVCSV